MPYLYKGKAVVTMRELVPVHYTYAALMQTLYRHKNLPYGPKRALLGGNGRELLVVLNSLPQKIREKFEEPTQEWIPSQYS